MDLVDHVLPSSFQTITTTDSQLLKRNNYCPILFLGLQYLTVERRTNETIAVPPVTVVQFQPHVNLDGF